MIGKLLFITLTLALASATPIARDLSGVDPNSLSCDPNGQIFLLLPHFTDCNKFFMCVHGQEVETTCGGSTLVFDFVLQTCNFDWATTCILRNADDSSEEEGSGDVVLDLRNHDEGDDTAISPIEIVDAGPFGFSVVDCLNPTTASRQAAYRGDCQRFWRCVNSVPQASFCSDGLFFNPKSEQCDYEANVQCLDNIEELEDGFLVY